MTSAALRFRHRWGAALQLGVDRTRPTHLPRRRGSRAGCVQPFADPNSETGSLFRELTAPRLVDLTAAQADGDASELLVYRAGCTCPVHKIRGQADVGTGVGISELHINASSGGADATVDAWLALVLDTLGHCVYVGT